MIEIPRDMKGLVKSITCSRTKVMVSGAMAMLAFCRGTERRAVTQQEVSVLRCHPGCGPTHPVHQLPHHPIPHLGVRVSGTVLAVPHQLESVGETNMLGNLRGEFGAVTFVLLISHKLVMVLLQHHVWSFLLECTWRILILLEFSCNFYLFNFGNRVSSRSRTFLLLQVPFLIQEQCLC